MRTRSALSLVSGSVVVASALLMGCGNGDDSSAAVPSAPVDASVSDAAKDGATSGDGAAKTDGEGGDGGTVTPASLKHVYIIMMENHAQAQIIGDTADAPNFNMLAAKYGMASSYYGVTHPSLPNYLASISGDFQGIWDDCNAGPTIMCPAEEFIPGAGDGTESQYMSAQQSANAATIPHWFSSRTIVDQLEENGLTWKAYMGSLVATGDITPGEPFIPLDGGPDADGVDAGTDMGNLYQQKHDPFMYFQNIRSNTNRMQKIVPYTELATDLGGASMPNYVWISPDQCADMHGINGETANFADAGFCTGTAAGNDMSPEVIQYGDAFVGNLVPQIMASPTWSEGSAIAIVFDEDDYVGTAGCCNSPTAPDGGTLGGALVPAIIISSLVTSPTTSTDPYNHYSLLATIENMWGLGCLANTCGMKGTALMTKLFVP